MFERATGWLGYTPKEALSSNVNDLQAALNGRFELLKMIFGDSSKDKQESGPPRPVTADRFRAMARQHNASRNRG